MTITKDYRNSLPKLLCLAAFSTAQTEKTSLFLLFFQKLGLPLIFNSKRTPLRCEPGLYSEKSRQSNQ